MTFTIFVSISLLALVVTARPYPLADPEHGDGSNTTQLNADGRKANAITTRTLRDAVQAVFKSRAGYPLPGLPSSLSDTDIRVHLTSPSVLTSHLAALEGLDAVKAVLPLPFSALGADAGHGIGADGAELSELTDEEKQLYELLRNSPPNGSLEDIDGGVRPVPELAHLQTSDTSPSEHSLAATADADDESSVTDASTGSSTPPTSSPASPALLVLAVSAVASLLVVIGLSLSIYTVSYFRRHVLRSNIAWDAVPRIEKGAPTDAQDGDAGGDSGEGGEVDATCEEVVVEKPQDLIDFEGPIATAPRSEDDVTPPPEYSEKNGIIELDGDEVRAAGAGDSDLNEKSAFYDATDSPLLFVHEPLPSPHPDPDFLPLPSDTSTPTTSPYATPRTASPALRVEPLAVPPSLKRLPSQTQMREREGEATTPVSKPAWSVRAASSPALGLPASSTLTPTTSPLPFSSPARAYNHTRTPSPPTTMPGALFSEPEADAQEMAEVERPARARAYRAPMPELDIAFALQLRPGLGLGAEGAWLVRFLMAMFGWLGVVVGGGNPGQTEGRRALMA
ncbi:uncharacterized protein B0H18DRAFT_1121950 [Fomitopsis serialis]|uniref:uncharacterized protein n=1 Tax=Fomitopsis serialis TaxID=139415 RepID=UPI002007BE80|nr:uncharacterized protein B0H18DRAFT_1121950 [Neoantrodia serialis]KAH9920350.1 hypothetical protein B0H18DRAFT_1121950 [Neoantrodia serialis]